MEQVDNPGIQAGMSNPCELDNPEYPVYFSYTCEAEGWPDDGIMPGTK